MATVLIESGLKRLGHSLSLAVWWSGWLMLGELGRRYTPLLADGVVPLAVWLCSVAASVPLTVFLCSSPRRLSNVIVVGSAVTGAALLWTQAGGGAAALLLAAAPWGVLVVALDRAAGATDGGAHRSPADFLLAGLGALLAWIASDRGVLGAAGLIGLCGAYLAALCRGAGREDLAGARLRRCMPAGWACMVSADGNWVVRCTRAVMVPMMASLMFSSEWCVGAGSSDRTTAIGAHLVSMFLLPCLLRACGVRVAAAWLALPMGASAMLLVVLPGADGLMAASMTQSLAWGLSFVVGPKHAPSVNGEVGAAGFSLALVAIGAVIALGLAGSAVGPFALLSVHAALGIGAVTAALVSISPLATAVAWR